MSKEETQPLSINSDNPTVQTASRFPRNLGIATLIVLTQAGLSAAYGATGATMLSHHYNGYDVTESALLTTVGSTMITAAVALISLLHSCCNKQGALFACCPEVSRTMKAAVGSFSSAVLGSLLSHAIFSNNPGIATDMPMEKLAAASATGAAAIMAIPAFCSAKK